MFGRGSPAELQQHKKLITLWHFGYRSFSIQHNAPVCQLHSMLMRNLSSISIATSRLSVFDPFRPAITFWRTVIVGNNAFKALRIPLFFQALSQGRAPEDASGIPSIPLQP